MSCRLVYEGASVAQDTGVNPLRAAKQLAAAKLAALLANYSEDPGLEQQLQDLAMATIHKGTEGFLRRDPDAREEGAPEPPWIPTASTELVDRLAAAGLARFDEEKRQWLWTDEWLAGQLAYGAFLRGEGPDVAERWKSVVRSARTRIAENALTHLADDCITGDEREWLKILLKYPLGTAAIAGALALRAPVGDESVIAGDLETFGTQLDQVLGPVLALQPVAETARSATVMDLAADRLAGFEGLKAAHRLLRRRLVDELEQLVEMRPREMRYARALAKAHLAAAEAEALPALALEGCAHALAAWRRFAAALPGDSWAPSFLLRLTRVLAELPREGDPARFHEVDAAAIVALEGLPDDAATRETTLRRQILLIAWTLALEQEADPSERQATFERGLARIEELIALCPGDTDYLRGKREFLEEFAKFLEASDAPRAERLRAEARGIEVPDPAEASPEPSGGDPSPPTRVVAAAPAVARESPVAEAEGDLEALSAEIHEAAACAREDPVRAIRLADAVVERIARTVLARELGPLPGDSSASQIATWAASSPVWPARLRHVFVVFDWHRNESLEGLAGLSVIGSAPGVHCCAAMARVVHWYFEEYLRAPLSVEIASEPEDEPDPPGPRRVQTSRHPLRGSGSPVSSTDPPHRTLARARRPAAPDPARDLEEAPLRAEQVELARRLGVPPRIHDAATGMALVLVPGGTVRLRTQVSGSALRPDLSPHPQLVARIRPFYIGIAPMLQEEWARVMDQNPSALLGPRLPVTDLTWEGALAFLARVNEGRSGPPLRLPLEPEWELAARGGTTTRYWWGDAYQPGWVNCADDGIGSGLQEPNPPGRFPANPYGIYDVLGNVREWCHGAHFASLEEFTPFRPALEATADDRALLCGGSWQSFPTSLAFPEPNQLGILVKYDGSVGFRCARDVESGRGPHSTADTHSAAVSKLQEGA